MRRMATGGWAVAVSRLGMWRIGFAAAMLALTAAIAGCGTSAAGGADAGGAPRRGGTLTFAVSSDAGCVDPQQVGSNDSIYPARQLVDSLTDQDPATGAIVPWLARSWQVGAGGRTFTFHLREGATFSDGSPVDAAAVKANFDKVPTLGARASLASGYLTGYQGSTVLDPRTVRVSFARPNAQFLQASSTFSLGLVAPASAARSADQRCAGIVGSGPFVLDRYVPNQSITLSRRAGYGWGSTLWKHRGEAYLDRLVFQIVPESGVRTGSLLSGQVDAISSVGPQDEDAITGAGARLQARSNPGVVFNLGLNNSRPILKDKAVRVAIAHAIDRPELVTTALTRESRPATSILASTTPYYTDLSADLSFDAGLAKSTLDGAGWTPGPDGIRVKDGQRLRLDIGWFANLATNKPVLELLQQQLKAVGVEVALHEYPIANIVQVQRSGDFDALWGNTTRADPDVLRTLYATGLVNAYRLAPGQLDAVLRGQGSAIDPAARRQQVATAQQLIVRQAYVIPVVELTTVLGVSATVHDLAFEASSRLQFHDTWTS
jgi:peptide/nickel transport system substrate-binding protein